MDGYEAKPVTRETVRAALRAAYEAVMAEPVKPHQHVVHPKAMERGGWARCADCYGPVYLGERDAPARQAEPAPRPPEAVVSCHDEGSHGCGWCGWPWDGDD